MNTDRPVELDWRDRAGVDAACTLITSVFDDTTRYGRKRIAGELSPLPLPHYRRFLVIWHHGRMVGAGGIKSADWASNTHLLYLSAVDTQHRGQGFGRTLVQARLDWILERHERGRILVSTARPKRYRSFGFREIGRDRDCPARLMLLEF